ncbi:MAG: hypothetical protein ABIP61_13775 [Burkholderiaceae bacterium]
MSQGFGIEAPGEHSHTSHRRPVRYVVIIEAAGAAVARLFLDTREAAGEFDAAAEDVARMTQGLMPTRGASGPEWDRALSAHRADERAAAEIYTLAV